MELIPIKEKLDENAEFASHPLCEEILSMTVNYYKNVGYSPPWIGYFVMHNNVMVASAGFKGRPMHGTVEIAYGTFENFRRQGIGATICKQLVELSLNTDLAVRITARTLPQNNFSTRILEKNNFVCLGIVEDLDDGSVWEWEYQGN